LLCYESHRSKLFTSMCTSKYKLLTTRHLKPNCTNILEAPGGASVNVVKLYLGEIMKRVLLKMSLVVFFNWSRAEMTKMERHLEPDIPSVKLKGPLHL